MSLWSASVVPSTRCSSATLRHRQRAVGVDHHREGRRVVTPSKYAPVMVVALVCDQRDREVALAVASPLAVGPVSDRP